MRYFKRFRLFLIPVVMLPLSGCSFFFNPQQLPPDSGSDTGQAGISIEEDVRSLPPVPDEEVIELENTEGYEAYSADLFNELLGSESFALFFHAGWCPTCRAMETEILGNLSALNGHIMLKADYDTETELKKEYGVTVQTTVIFFNADGSIAKKTINPPLSEIKAFFK
jgi:thiol-disulfide isomerase/thioredoxin